MLDIDQISTYNSAQRQPVPIDDTAAEGLIGELA